VAFIEVKNKQGTADRKPPAGYSSWLEFWEKKRGKKAQDCEVLGCSGKAEVGGHVIRVGAGSKEYILPMCAACNSKPEHDMFKAWDSDLVPVS